MAERARPPETLLRDAENTEDHEHNTDNELFEEVYGYQTDRMALVDRNSKRVNEPMTGQIVRDADGEEEQQTDMNAEEEYYHKTMTSLNRDQHKYMMHFLHEFTNKALYCDKKEHDQQALLELVVGGSGTGKSFLIKALNLTANRLINKLDKNNKQERVLLCAFTGKAAFNIGGKTCHSAFHLQRQKGNATTQVTVQ